MQILSIRYADAEQAGIEIETTEGRFSAPWPVNTWHSFYIDEWLASGNPIQPYVPPPEPVPNASPLQLFDELDEAHGIDPETEIGGLTRQMLVPVGSETQL